MATTATATFKGVKVLIKETNAIAVGNDPTNNPGAGIIDKDVVSSVPTHTKISHVFWPDATPGNITITLFASLDGKNWFTQPSWNANNPIGPFAFISDGNYPYFSHSTSNVSNGAS